MLWEWANFGRTSLLQHRLCGVDGSGNVPDGGRTNRTLAKEACPNWRCGCAGRSQPAHFQLTSSFVIGSWKPLVSLGLLLAI